MELRNDELAGNVTGSLHKKGSSKNYYAVIRFPGKNGRMDQKWISTKTSKKTEANIFLVEKIKEIKATFASEQEAKKNVDFIDLLENWRAAYERLEITTIEGYELNFDNHIIPYFKKQKLLVNEVKRKHIQAFIEYEGLHGRMDGTGGLKKESVKKFVSNLSIVLENAITEELIEVNPCDRVKYPLSIFDEEEYEAEYLDLDSLLKLFDIVFDKNALDNPDDDRYWGVATGIALASFYALRRGEIYGIKWSNIDMTNGLIYIEKTWVVQKNYHEKNPKNRASKAAMPLVPQVKSFLLRLMNHREKCKKFYGDSYEDKDLLVSRDSGKRFGIHYLNKKLQKILAANNLPVVCLHELRHSTATLLRSLGYSAQEIQSWLRHADIKSTMRYAHDNLEIKKKAAEKLNSLFKFE